MVSIEFQGTKARRNLQGTTDGDTSSGENDESDEAFTIPLLNSVLNPNGTISSSFTIPEPLRQYLEFDMKFSTNGDQFASIYSTTDSFKFDSDEISVKTSNPSPEEPTNPFEVSGTLEQIQATTSAVTQGTEALAMVGMAAGPAGAAVMRFTQILKVYNRLKYIGVGYGKRLDDYLTTIGQIFNDSEQDLDKINQIIKSEGGYGGKVSRYRVFGEPFSVLGWKVYAYFATFILNIVAKFLSSGVQTQGIVNKSAKAKIKVIGLLKHIHFMLFNMVLIDGSFYCSRVIAHIKVFSESGLFVIIISYVFIALVCLDIIEIFNTGLGL
jgi:hypothetical protein